MQQVSHQRWLGPYLRILDVAGVPTDLVRTLYVLTENTPTSPVGITFPQGLLLKVSYKPSRTGLQ